MSIPDGLRAAAALGRAAVSALPPHVRLLLMLMALDYASAWALCLLARRTGAALCFARKRGAWGLARKAMILCVALMACMLDSFIDSSAVSGAVTMFYLMGEALSVLENAAALGVPIPEKLKRFLDGAQDGEGDDSPPHAP